MKIGIASVGPDMGSQISQRFGRAPYFIIYDLESGRFEAVQNIVGGSGAGVKAGSTLSSKGVGYVITGGGIGPKAYEVLSSAGIKMIGSVSGTVEEAVERFKKGELKPSDDILVEGRHQH